MQRIVRAFGAIPHETKRKLKRLRYALDLFSKNTQPGDRPVPPRWLRFDSQNDHIAVGEHLLELCKRYGGLQPGQRVLDIGCGSGRLAAPLIDFLGEHGSYCGFDIDEEAVAWCASHIGENDQNVQFLCVAVRNEHYRRGPQHGAETLIFPYDSESFDFAVATSVFTHLTKDEAVNYVKQAARVLKPGGTALLTWFLVDPRTADDKAATSAYRFSHSLGPDWFTDTPSNPCAAIAFDTSWTVGMCGDAGLELVGSPLRGQWVDADGPTYQDTLVLRKPVSD